MTDYKPNAEQATIGRAFHAGGSLVIVAGAGTGKTSTLELLASKTPWKKFLYIAYNKSVQVEAQARFPRNVKCVTSHGLAYRTHGQAYSARLNAPRVSSNRAASLLGIRQAFPLGEHLMQPKMIAATVMRTVDRFCYSADSQISASHVPWMEGLEPGQMRKDLEDLIVPLAQKAWRDLLSADGQLRFTHDMYLKLFQLSKPRLPYDVILLDEAQDSNPCVADLVMSQERAQIVLVGDSNQAIYGWRGAEDAMENFRADNRLPLTGSYRFGPKIAAEANRWLEMLESDLRLKGWLKRESTIVADYSVEPTAILCRSNAGAMGQAIRMLKEGKRVGMVSGGASDPTGTNQIRAMARAAQDLLAGRSTDHPELGLFIAWSEVQEYAKEDGGSDLAPFVNLVDEHGPEAILSYCDQMTPERDAEVVVSTAHKAKGREWDAVQIADDFQAPKPGSAPRRDELMLAYVAITRAKFTLMRGSLAWIDEFGSASAAA